MRRQISSHIHKKYQPHKSCWQRFLSWRTKKKNKKIQKQHRVKAVNTYKANPFKKQQQTKRKIPFFVKILFLLLLIISWMVLLFYFPFFRINKIKINGLQNIKYQEMEKSINKYLHRCKYLSCNNYFLVKTESIYNNLIKEFAVKNLEIKKVFPNTLIVNLTEQKTALIYDNGQSYYLVGNSGQIIKLLRTFNDNDYIYRQSVTTTTSTFPNENKQVTTTIKIHAPNYKLIQKDYGNFPLLYDKRSKNIKIGDTVLPKNMVPYLVNFKNDFSVIGKGSVNYFLLEYIDEGVKAIINKKWNLLLNQQGSIKIQLKNLQIILNNNNPSEYVDLREESRVFWK